jgi:hypothetical protein
MQAIRSELERVCTGLLCLQGAWSSFTNTSGHMTMPAAAPAVPYIHHQVHMQPTLLLSFARVSSIHGARQHCTHGDVCSVPHARRQRAGPFSSSLPVLQTRCKETDVGRKLERFTLAMSERVA